MYSHAATILSVNDILTSVRFYTEKLNFDCSFQWENPPTYAVLTYKDRIHLHLSLADQPIPTHNPYAALYVFVEDADEVYQSLKSKDVKIHHPIGTRDYGMRDFDILDPSGYLLTFGTSIVHNQSSD